LAAKETSAEIPDFKGKASRIAPMKPTRSERAKRYLANMPIAIAGQGGNTATFNACVIAAVGFDLDDEQSLSALADWNARSQPPWQEKDLLRKIRSAKKDCRRPPGYLLDDGDCVQKADKPFIPTPATFTPNKPDPSDLETFRKRRGLSQDSIRCATSLGALQVGTHNHYGRCVAMCENDWWQSRPIVESVFRNGEKVMGKPGTAPQFFGASWLGDCPNVLLVEGCIGWLEAVDAIGQHGDIQWGALAAYNAHSSFAKDLPTLGRMFHRNITIIPDSGAKGREACERWIPELKTLGCSIEIATLPDDCTDLGDVLKRGDRTQFLTELFS